MSSSHAAAVERLDVRMVSLCKRFEKGGQRIDVLSGIDLEIRQGERLSIVGASGTGKSTLLHIVGTLDRPTEGQLLYNSLDVFALPPAEIARLRNATIGFVFQFHHLLQEFTAIENAMMPSIIAGMSLKDARAHGEEGLVSVGLKDRLHHRPGELSGGEQQRVAIARAISRSPRLLLADEPTGNLDSRTGGAIHELLVRLNEERALTLVVVTHNLDLAAKMERRLHMADGTLREEPRDAPMNEPGGMA